MSNGRVNWSMLLVALACLVPVVAGAALLLSGDQGGKALGWGLVGFFGAGVVVLGRKAFSG